MTVLRGCPPGVYFFEWMFHAAFFFLFQRVVILIPLEKLPGHFEKFKMLNPFEEIVAGCLGFPGDSIIWIC
jgi:hypothetical protein